MNQNKSFKQKLLLTWNRVLLDFNISIKERKPQLVIHERFKPAIFIIKVILTIIGLASAFITFDSVLISFAFGLGVYLLSTAFERIIFSYNSLYINPLPNFEIEKEKWLGCSFGFATSETSDEIPVVGWIISEVEYARKIHALLLEWTGKKLIDEDKNVKLSAIIENDEYTFFCYPCFDKKSIGDFHKSVEVERKQKSLTDVHHKLMLSLIFGKVCKITSGSYFPTFRKRYRSNTPFYFQITVLNPDGQPTRIDDLNDFVLFDIKIKEKSELTRKDVEYDIMRLSE